MAHSFGHTFIAKFAEPIASLSRTQLENMEGERKIDEDFMTLTLELVMRLLFGNTVGKDQTMLFDAFQTISLYFSNIMSPTRFPLWFPTPMNVRYKRAIQNMNQVVERILADRRSKEEPHSDILSRLVEDSAGLTALDEAKDKKVQDYSRCP